jgi:hypothetical protein
VRRVETSEGVRLAGDRCALEIRRLKPGAVLVTISGDDAGELGAAPHDELDREIARYGPLELRVDARATTGVGPGVAAAWTEFLGRRGNAVRKAVVLVASRQVALAAQSAGALAGAPRALSVTNDAAAFDAEVARLGGLAPPAAVPISREAGPEGVALAAGKLRATVARLGRAAHVVLTGFDGGQLCAALFDEIAARLAGEDRWELFLDASACSGVAGRSADAWTAWVAAHRDRLSTLHVLATAPAVRLALGIEGEMGAMRDLIRVYTEPEAFARAVAARRR